MKLGKLALTTLATIAFISCAQAKIASSLLGAFGNQCPRINVTAITGPVLGAVDSLESAIDNIRQDPDCSGLYNTLSNLQILNSQVTKYEAQRNANKERVKSEKLVSEYTSLLADPSYPDDLRTLIQNSILEEKKNIINYNEDYGYYTHGDNQYAQAATTAVNGTIQLFKQIENSPKCLRAKSHIIASVISQTLSISSSFMPPGSALAFAGAGVLTEGILSFSKNFKSSRIKNEIDMAKAPLALECTLSALTDRYCAAVDTQRLVNLTNRQRRQRRSHTDGALAGIEMLNKDLTSLDIWLTKVYAGSPISSEGDRVNREKPQKEKEALESIEGKIQVYILEQNEKIASSDPSRVEGLYLTSFKGLSARLRGDSNGRFGGDNSPNPITENNDRDQIIFYLYTGKWEFPRNCTDGNGAPDICKDFDTFLSRVNKTVNSSDWINAISRTNDIIKLEKAGVNLRLERVRNLNPENTLTEITFNYNNSKSAIDGLISISKNAERIEKYLRSKAQNRGLSRRERLKFKAAHTNVLFTMKKTEKILDLAEAGMDLLSNTSINLPEDCTQIAQDQSNTSSLTARANRRGPTVEESAATISGCISKILNLNDRGTSLYFNELKTMVRHDIETRIKENELNQDLSTLIIETREDVVDALLKTYPSNVNQNRDTILGSLKTSKTILNASIGVFFDSFGKTFFKVLEKATPETQSRMCIWSLTMPKKLKGARNRGRRVFGIGIEKKINKICRGKYLKSKYGHTISYNYSKGKPVDEKMCLFWKYYKKGDLTEKKLSTSN